MSKSYICKVVEDPDYPGELALDIPDDLIELAGLAIGDELQWINNENGSWSIIKST